MIERDLVFCCFLFLLQQQTQYNIYKEDDFAEVFKNLVKYKFENNYYKNNK